MQHNALFNAVQRQQRQERIRTQVYWVAFCAAAFLIASVLAAWAGSNCYALGNQWICNGDNGFNSNSYSLGNQTITSGSYRDPYSGQTRSFNQTCYWVGNQRICN
jgi:hypothetical protein